MLSLPKAASDVVGALQGFLGLSRTSRLRRQLQHTVELYERVKPHPELAGVATQLVAVMEIHGERLLLVSQPRSRDWSSFIAGAILTTGFGALGWWVLRTEHSQWWGWVLVVPIGLVVVAGLSVTFGYIRGRPADRKIQTTVDLVSPALVAAETTPQDS